MRERRLDEAAMCELARDLGRRARGGEVLLLDGEMGAGKTTFVRALAEGLGVKRPSRVRSPTYALCLRHAGPIELVHLDLFRLGEEGGGIEAAVGALGLDRGAASWPGSAPVPASEADPEDPEGLWGPGRFLAVEWSEMWSDLPIEHLRLNLRRSATAVECRVIRASAVGPRADALLAAWWPDDEKSG